MTTLVTGATGFVGAAVVRRLLARGTAVRVLARDASDRRNIAGLEVETVAGDLRDRASLEKAARGCVALYHVAADYRLWVREPETIYRVNVEGSRDLLRAAAEAGVTRMVYTSSVATLGLKRDGTPADETTPVALGDMIGHYKRSKYLAEEEVRRLIADEGLPVVIVNPSTPIGPRDVKPTPTGRVIVEAAAGRMPAFVDTGLNVVHVEDVAEGHLLAFDRGRVGERYVLGGRDMTLAEILAVIAPLVGRRPPRVRIPHDLILPLAHAAEAWARLRRKGEPFVTVDGIRMAKKRMFFSSARAESELGYAARPAEHALEDAVAWFKDEGYLD
ncbi:MAG: NAD-dependent epimerase/dehydratase family protein [Rhodospirillales bacterium]|nr:NAD-dependent epimerase/dehydratase family protein [Rhodospirillales bacterium]MDH3792876.1 NAD-dependent epimerase/dehydratase family protein [Rhodospirillales bacterium]MDH3910593.1 NAD-dependent epimerase/dehydratase family protein [Rhodospirillales bacterium]MDH3967600.1 NAD-dependent epimerase/dehydratase family protein [Rhodospirillales bacterium]